MSTLGILSLMCKVFPPTHSTFMPQTAATIVLLNLHAWNYPSEPSTALTKFAGRPGDMLLMAVCKPPHLLAFSYGDCDATLVTVGYAH